MILVFKGKEIDTEKPDLISINGWEFFKHKIISSGIYPYVAINREENRQIHFGKNDGKMWKWETDKLSMPDFDTLIAEDKLISLTQEEIDEVGWIKDTE